MKKMIAGLVLGYFSIVQLYSQIQNVSSNQKTLSRLGVLSPDSENEGNGKDPKYIMQVPEMTLNNVVLTGGNNAYLKDHPQAQAIAAQQAAYWKGKEISVSILPQHKYMISECLGIKASVGEYKIQFSTPFVKIDENGLYMKFQIDKISDKRVTVRTRPCYKDGQCHFSPQLEISGTMTDVRLEITCNPVMDMANCNILSLGQPHFKWRIGGLNFKPLQNNLDEMIKNMMEDALTVASELIMPGRIGDALNKTVTQFCGSAPSVTVKDNDQSTASTAISTGSVENRWEIKSNPALKGSTGQIIIKTPEVASMIVHLFKPGEKNHFDAWYTDKTANFLPGYYDIKINEVRMNNVPIEKGKATRIKLGILHIPFDGGYAVRDNEGNLIRKVSGNEKRKLVLPVGKYKIEIASGTQDIEIKDGEISEF